MRDKGQCRHVCKKRMHFLIIDRINRVDEIRLLLDYFDHVRHNFKGGQLLSQTEEGGGELLLPLLLLFRESIPLFMIIISMLSLEMRRPSSRSSMVGADGDNEGDNGLSLDLLLETRSEQSSASIVRNRNNAGVA